MSDIEKLHKEMIDLGLGDLLIIAGQAINMNFDKQRVDLILRYVDIALVKRKLSSRNPDCQEGEK